MTELELQEMYDFYQRLKQTTDLDLADFLKGHHHTGNDYPKVDYNDLDNLPDSGVEITAFESLSVGDVVKVVENSGAANLAKVIGLGTLTNGFTAQALSGTPTSGGSCKEVLKLSETTVVACGEVSNNTASTWQFYVAGTISGSTISWGSPEYISLGGSSGFPVRLVRIDDTHFVFVTQSTNGTGIIPACYVVAVSGNSVSRGSVDNFGYSYTGGNDWSPYDAVLIDTNTILVLMNDSADTDTNAKAATVDTSAKTFTVGTEYQVSSSTLTKARVHLLTTNRVLFTSQGTTSYRVATISGTTISTVASNTFSFTPQRFRFMKGATAQEGLAIYYDGTDCKIAKMTESAGTCTFTLTTDLLAGASTGILDDLNNLEVYDAAKNMWVVHPDNSSASTARLATLCSDRIYLETAITFSTTASLTFGMAGKEKFVGIRVIGNSTSKYATMSFDYTKAVGIANAAVSSGTAVEVKVAGDVSTVQSGLTPGLTYYINSNGGALTTAPGSVVNGTNFDNKLFGKALSATELLIQAI